MTFSIFAAVISSCNGLQRFLAPSLSSLDSKINHLHMDSLEKKSDVYLFSSLVLNFISSAPTISLCCKSIAHWGITHRAVCPEQKSDAVHSFQKGTLPVRGQNLATDPCSSPGFSQFQSREVKFQESKNDGVKLLGCCTCKAFLQRNGKAGLPNFLSTMFTGNMTVTQFGSWNLHPAAEYYSIDPGAGALWSDGYWHGLQGGKQWERDIPMPSSVSQ